DPAHADSQTADRRKGGAAPRRRFRRYPRRLDRPHLAELLGEMLISGMNHKDDGDFRHLQLLVSITRLILRTIDHPSYLASFQQAAVEPTAAEPHLLRVYAPLVAEIEALLEDDPDPVPVTNSTSADDPLLQPAKAGF